MSVIKNRITAVTLGDEIVTKETWLNFNEVNFLTQLKSKHVIRMKRFWVGKSIYFTRDYSLFLELERGLPFTRLNSKRIKDLILIQYFLMIRGVAHCDISKRNYVIVDERVKIIDFDLATLDINTPKLRYDEYLRPPELCSETFEGFVNMIACDIWALGALLYAIMQGDKFSGNFDNLSCSKSTIDLMAGFLQVNPISRIEYLRSLFECPKSIPHNIIPSRDELTKTLLNRIEKTEDDQLDFEVCRFISSHITHDSSDIIKTREVILGSIPILSKIKGKILPF